MADDASELESELTELGERLRHGWANLHSVSETEREAVLRVVREEWEQEQQLLQSGGPSKGQMPHKTKTPGGPPETTAEQLPNDLSRPKPPERDRGPSL
jgi:hypothetical protein